MQLYMVLKRMVDVIIGFIALVILAIPFAVIALAIKFESQGPVFFRQDRVGRHGKPFKIWKFRTMLHDPSRKGYQPPPMLGDARITRVGNILRKSGVDELPQLFNVLFGDMSLVGPRPVHPFRAANFNKRQKRRLFVKPGITGWALIHGRNSLVWKKKLEYDLWYIDHVSFWLDLFILWRTPWIILWGEGVFMDSCDSLVKHNNSSEKKCEREIKKLKQ